MKPHDCKYKAILDILLADIKVFCEAAKNARDEENEKEKEC